MTNTETENILASMGGVTLKKEDLLASAKIPVDPADFMEYLELATDPHYRAALWDLCFGWEPGTAIALSFNDMALCAVIEKSHIRPVVMNRIRTLLSGKSNLN